MSKFLPALILAIIAAVYVLLGIHETQWTIAEKYGADAILFGLLAFMAASRGFW